MAGTHDEIKSFVTEGTHRLATISTNDYGYQLSARMAQTYLARAVEVLESKRTSDREMLHDIGALKARAAALAGEYAQLDAFCTDCERFKRIQTRDALEWMSKQAVRLIARKHLATTGYHLAYKIRTFHSRACSILVEE